MGDTRSEEERLPWLVAPRPAKPGASARKSPPKAAKRARGPIFVLLALFLMTGVGMIAYLAGRGSVPLSPASDPVLTAPSTTRQATVTLPPPPPPLPPESVKSEVRMAENSAPSAKIKPSAQASTSGATRTTGEKARSRPVRQAKAAPSQRAIRARRAIRQMPPLVRASPVVQLGIYRTRGQANAAFRRLTKVYPYLKRLPRDVRPITYSDNTRLYRLRLREYSPEYARILCGNLRSIGRGCTVLPVS